jgi:hypothetical protein
MRWYFGLFFLALLGIPTGFAQNEMFTANPDQSEVAFSLGDVMHSVHRSSSRWGFYSPRHTA